MVDAEGALLGEGGGDGIVDLAARREVVAERLFEREADAYLAVLRDFVRRVGAVAQP